MGRKMHISKLQLKDFEKHKVWSWSQEGEEEDAGIIAPVDCNSGVIDYEDYHAIFLKCSIQLNDGTTLNGIASIGGDDLEVYMLDIFQNCESCSVPLQKQLRKQEVLIALQCFLGKTETNIFPMLIQVRVPCIELTIDQIVPFPYVS